MTKLYFKAPALALGLALGIAAPATAQTVIGAASFEPAANGNNAIQYGPDQFAAHNRNAMGPATVTGFAFNGYSGLISNNTAEPIFVNTTAGSQAAFLQAYAGDGFAGGSSIVWTLPGLIAGRTYNLTLSSAGSLVVPSAPVSILAGLGSTTFTPGQTYGAYNLRFTATGNTITFSTPGGPGNVATALDDLAVTAVPEPATWGMMLLGFAMMGFGLRRRGAARPAIT